MLSISTDSHELAWAAGFFDGEGYVSSIGNRQGRYYPYITLSQSGEQCPSTLIRFKEALGVGRITGPYSYPSKVNRKPVWRYNTTRWNDTLKAVELLRPYLSEYKMADMERVIAKFVATAPNPKSYIHKGDIS